MKDKKLYARAKLDWNEGFKKLIFLGSCKELPKIGERGDLERRFVTLRSSKYAENMHKGYNK